MKSVVANPTPSGKRRGALSRNCPARPQPGWGSLCSPVHKLEAVLVKCPGCRDLLYSRELHCNLKVCPTCGHHFRLSAKERIQQLLDAGTFEELAGSLRSVDPLHFVSPAHSYREKLAQECDSKGLHEAVVVGHGRIEGSALALAVMDFHFIGGSMGSVVGEKITRCIEYAIDAHLPLLIVSASGGARMQEGLFSLLQMAKTSAAVGRLARAGVPFISLLTDPTMGGVTASFAFLGDIILAEPGAMVGFAGPRVIEQFMHQCLPKEAATAESAFQHGMIDGIVPRPQLRKTLARLLRLYNQTRLDDKECM